LASGGEGGAETPQLIKVVRDKQDHRQWFYPTVILDDGCDVM